MLSCQKFDENIKKIWLCASLKFVFTLWFLHTLNKWDIMCSHAGTEILRAFDRARLAVSSCFPVSAKIPLHECVKLKHHNIVLETTYIFKQLNNCYFLLSNLNSINSSPPAFGTMLHCSPFILSYTFWCQLLYTRCVQVSRGSLKRSEHVHRLIYTMEG